MTKQTIGAIVIVATGVIFSAQLYAAVASDRRGFSNRDAVLKRFDEETEAAVSALESVLDRHGIVAEAESAILERSIEEKVGALRQAEQILFGAGISADSAEIRALRKAAIGTEQLPNRKTDDIEAETK